MRAVPLDADGLDVDALAALLDGGLRPKLLYTIPDYQNPAGVTLAAERRAALVELARRTASSSSKTSPTASSASTARASERVVARPDVVVQAGTTSKTFFPGVRLGWAVGPAEVVAQLVSAKQNTDQCSGALGQRLFEEYVRRGWIEEQLQARARCTRGNGRCSATRSSVRCRRGRVDDAGGGFFSWLSLATDATELARRAADEGVAVVPGALFYPDGRGHDEPPPVVQRWSTSR